MLVQSIQNILIEEVRNNLTYYVQLKWRNNMGYINIYTKKYNLLKQAVDLSTNHTRYWKKQYEIDNLIIKEIKNNNPHIKINIDDLVGDDLVSDLSAQEIK